ncbi:Asp23/Gls24 family envelope stress response protein [Mycolicibacterium arseniciresistens]|uniref:Asp23/Gls24 family envelope stress response protein n=1 Tax=Mycolicibacterium arseniciresistens TaxID=3062257 RepID=A0ABT8US12_9MYCO|nr:Asp23/Gls24 family envelope stress response protein [Mycolicibacterium arseniciresistens]MDO3639193.1 Asp23/Gls24 family envelope stress response protein [Mycolicibacterium arseniciresistens]
MAEPVVDDPGSRGRLVVHERAVQSVALAAALGVEGVHRLRRGPRVLGGTELPRADVAVRGEHVHATVEVAAGWGRSLTHTAEAVALRVRDALGSLSGFVVDGVDVHVAAVVPPDEHGRLR